LGIPVVLVVEKIQSIRFNCTKRLNSTGIRIKLREAAESTHMIAAFYTFNSPTAHCFESLFPFSLSCDVPKHLTSMRPLSSSPSSVDPWLGLREDATTANQQVWRFFPPPPPPLSPQALVQHKPLNIAHLKAPPSCHPCFLVSCDSPVTPPPPPPLSLLSPSAMLTKLWLTSPNLSRN
jgi:hypothetical protein